eukprot:6211998-Pleurochrysis_carterae.AAC.2
MFGKPTASSLTEDISPRSPSLFSSKKPIGDHFQVDRSHRGTQSYEYTFSGSNCACVLWVVMYNPLMKRGEIGRLHAETARLLAVDGVPDELATEKKYIPIGCATTTCSTCPRPTCVPSSALRQEDRASDHSTQCVVGYKLYERCFQPSSALRLVSPHCMGSIGKGIFSLAWHCCQCFCTGTR